MGVVCIKACAEVGEEGYHHLRVAELEELGVGREDLVEPNVLRVLKERVAHLLHASKGMREYAKVCSQTFCACSKSVSPTLA